MSERENTISYTRLTSFLRKDTSFLSPWSWPVRNRNAAAVNIETSSSRNVEQYLLQPGSYFESIWGTTGFYICVLRTGQYLSFDVLWPEFLNEMHGDSILNSEEREIGSGSKKTYACMRICDKSERFAGITAVTEFANLDEFVCSTTLNYARLHQKLVNSNSASEC
ncbi:hypothetical protein JHK85_015939 [Glycine max]|nr:hypothetical protein JHK85_015939 [Glycine max]